MTRLSTWPPQVGDTVRIKDAQVNGTVTHTKGVSGTRFRILVTASARDMTRSAIAERRLARRASRWYGLEELDPVP